MNVINQGEVVEGVTGEVAGVLLVGDLTWRALKVRQVVYKLNQTHLILHEAPICASQDLQPGPS